MNVSPFIVIVSLLAVLQPCFAQAQESDDVAKPSTAIQASSKPDPTTTENDADTKGKASEKAVREADRAVSAVLVDPDMTYEFGDDVRIRVAGKHQMVLNNAVAGGVYLVLDGVVMSTFSVPTVERDGADTGLVLSFRISRDASNASSRDEWALLLTKQQDYVMKPHLGLAMGTAGAFPVRGDFKFRITSARLFWGTIIVGLVGLALFYLMLIRSRSALRDSIDGPYSLGRSQMAFWGLLVPITFVGVWCNTGMIEHIPPQVLILIGISAGTGLAAQVIGKEKQSAVISNLQHEAAAISDPDARGAIESKIVERVLSESTGVKGPAPLGAQIIPPRRKFLMDICDDGNGLSFHRLQVVIWTAVLGMIYVRSVTQSIAMPEFPDTLLMLMGISSSIYLGFKIPEKTK